MCQGFLPVLEGLDLAQAAALPKAVETAARSIDLLGITAGQTLMVNGAGKMTLFAAVRALAGGAPDYALHTPQVKTPESRIREHMRRCHARCTLNAVEAIGLGTVLAVLFNQEFFGRGIARVLTLAPFFVMPTVSALVWKNMMLHPDNGIAAFIMRSLHLQPIDWFAVAPMTSIIAIVAWEWLPFAFRTLLTAVQSLDAERMEAARMDGAGPIALFRYIIWPHLDRAVIAVTMIESIFLLGIFAEIYVTTSGGPGYASSDLAFLIYRYALSEYDIGGASVCGVIAIVLANVLALLLMRSFARNVEG